LKFLSTIQNIVTALGFTPVNKAGDTVTGELHLQNTSVRDYLKLERTGSNAARFWFSLGYGHFSIDSDSGQYLFSVKSNGNVGVGTGNSSTGPTQKLDVDGKIRMRTQTQATDADDTVATKKYVDDVVAASGVETGSTLPAPDATWYTKLFILIGGTGVADHLYVCLKKADGSYWWCNITGLNA